MKGFIGDIEALTVGNTHFRRVLYTGRNLQLVLMTLKPGEEIGTETHQGNDQFFRVEKGRGETRAEASSGSEHFDGRTTETRTPLTVKRPASAESAIPA